LRALVAAAMFLAGTLGPSWFAALEALQNAGYVLTTRGTAPSGSAALGPKTGVTSGTPSKRGGALADGLAGGGPPVLCPIGELIRVSANFLPHPSFWLTCPCSGTPGGAQYTLLQPQDHNPALHTESGFTDGSDVIFSLCNEKAEDYHQNLAVNWREDAQGIMLIVSYTSRFR